MKLPISREVFVYWTTRAVHVSRRPAPARRSVTFLSLVLIALVGQSARAAIDTWTGTTDGTWANGANWGGAAPVTGDSLVFTSATGAGGLTLSDNLMTPGTFNVAGITFNAGAGAYVINPATPGANGFTLTGNMLNSSTSLETINDLIAMTAVNTFTMTAGGGNITLGGNITGTGGGILTAGTGTLILSGTADSYTGLTTAATGTTIQLGSGATILSGNALTTVGTGAFDINGNAQTLGLLTDGGTVTNSGASATLTIGNGSTGAGNFTGSMNVVWNNVATNSTLSGGWTNTGSITLNANGAGTITLSGLVNNSGSIANTGLGSALTTLKGGVGTNITSITENSVFSALTVNTAALTVNSGGTTLVNANPFGGQVFTVSGGVANTSGNLILQNNSNIANGITLSTTAVNNIGTITNSGAGFGGTLISAAINSGVTGVIQNSATSSLTLSSANAFGGGLSVLNGTAIISNASGAGAQPITLGATGGVNAASLLATVTLSNAINLGTTTGTLTIGTNGSTSATFTGGVTGSNNVTLKDNGTTALTFLSGGLNNAGAITNIGTNSGTTTISSVIGPNVTGLIEDGYSSGGLTLSGTAVNTYTGPTAVNAGTLLENFSNLGSATNLINSASALALGGGTLSVQGNASNPTSQSFASLTVNAGKGVISLTPSGSLADTLNITSNAVTRATGGVVDFVIPTNGAVNLNPTLVNGIIAPWAVIGTGSSTQYATTSGGAITAYSGGLAITSPGSINDITGASNYLLSGTTSATSGANASVNTLQYTGSGLTITASNTGGLTANGILNDGGTLAFSGGSLIPGANHDLVITGSGNVSIASVLANNGANASALTYAGGGTLTLTNTGNTFNGPINIESGTLQLGTAFQGQMADSILGNANNSVTVASGITIVVLQSVSFSPLRNFTLMGGNTFNDIGSGTNNLIIQIPGNILGPGLRGIGFSGANSSNSMTYMVSGNNPGLAGGISLAANTPGATELVFSSDANIGGPTSSISTSSANGSPIELSVIGTQLTNLAAHSVNIGGGTPLIVEIQDPNNTFTFSAGIPADTYPNGGFTKSGAGTLNYTGTDSNSVRTHSVSGGTLEYNIAAGGSISNSTPVAIGGGAFYLLGKTTGTTVTLGGLTVNGLGGTLDVNSNTSGTTTLNLGGLGTGNTGGTLNIVPLGTTPANSIVTTTTANDTTGILSPRVIYNGTSGSADWAAGTGSTPFAIGAYASYTAIAAAATPSGSDTNNSLINASSGSSGIVTPTASWTTSTLKISGGSSLVLTGNTLSLGNATSLLGGGLLYTGSGPYSITGGTLKSINKSASTPDLIIQQYGAIGASNALTVGSTIANGGTGASTLTVAGPGTVILTAANSYTGQTYVDSGVLSISAANNISSAQLNLNGTLQVTGAGFATSQTISLGGNGGTFDIATGGTLTLNAAISGGNLTLGNGNGDNGTLVLAGGGSYSESVYINGGTLQLNSGAAISNLGFSSVTFGSFATTEVLDLHGNNYTFAGLTDATNASAVVESTSGSPTLNVFNGANNTFAGSITGSIKLVKAGAGALVLTGQSTYTGTTTLDGGIVNLGRAETAGVSGPLGASAATHPGSIILNGGTLQFSAANQNDYSGRFSTAAGQQYNIDTNGQTVTFATALTSGGGQLTKLDSGTLTSDVLILSGANTYNGPTTVSGGVLRAGVASVANVSGAFGNNSAVTIANVAGATLDLGGFNTQIGSLAGGGVNGGNVTLEAAMLSVGGDNTSTSYAGLISSSGTPTTSLIKIGSGTLTLNGLNTYTGATIVQSGILRVNSVSTGSNPQSLGADTGASAVVLGVAATSSGLLQYTGGAGTLDKSIAAVGNGSDTIQNAGSGLLTLSGPISNSLTTLTLNASGGSIAVSGQISGGTSGNFTSVLNVTSSSANSVTLNNANTYNGPTNVTGGGTLVNGVQNALPDGTVLTLGASSDGAVMNTFNLGGVNATVAALNSVSNGGSTNLNLVSGGGTLTISGVNSDGVAVNSTFGGTILNGLAPTNLTIAGGTTTLSGGNTFSGATLVSGGTLRLSGAGAINGTSGITINGSGAKFLQTSSTAVLPTVTLTNGTLDGTGTVNTVNVGNGTGGVIANGNGAAGTPLAIGSLSFGGAATVSLLLNGTSPGLITTNLSTNALGQVTVNASNASWTNGTTYDLISYSSLTGNGFAGFTQGTVLGLGARQSAMLGNNGSDVTLVIGGVTPVWTGAQSSLWSTSPVQNWQTPPSTPTAFLSSDQVLFDDTAAATATVIAGATSVTITDNTVNPTSTTFNNSMLSYTITGSGSFGITSGSLVKSGTASVTLAANDTYAGGTTLNAGTLVLGNASAIGTGLLTINGGALDSSVPSLVLSTNNAQSWAGDFTFVGSNDLNLGTGAVDLGATAGATRSVTVTAGTLTVGGGISNGTNGTTPTINLTLAGAGTLQLNGANSYTGATTINGGTLALGSSGTLASPSITVAGSGSLFSSAGSINSATNLTLNASGAAAFTSASQTIATIGGDGSGTLTLTGTALTITGGGTVPLVVGTGSLRASGGTLTLANGGDTFSGGTTVVNSGATLSINNDGTVTGVNTPLGAIPASPANNLFLNGGTLQATGSFTLNANRGVALGPSSGSGSGTFDVTGSNAVTVAGNIVNNGSGSGALVLTDTGTLNISGTNTYSGGTQIQNGTLRLGSSGAFPTGALTLGNGASNGTLDLNGFNANATSIVTGGTMAASQIITNSNTSGNGLTSTLTYSGGVSTTLNAAIQDGAGKVALAINSLGGLMLGGNNAYSGGTTLTAGSLTFGSATAIGTGTLTINGGTIDSSVPNLVLSTNNAQNWNTDVTFVGTNSLNLGTGPVALGGTGTIRKVAVNGNTLTVGGNIGGSFGLFLSNGTLALAGNGGTYTGPTTVDNGTLIVSSIANLGVPSSLGAPTTAGNGTITIGDRDTVATLRYIGTGNTTNRIFDINPVQDRGSPQTIDDSGTGTLNLTGDPTSGAAIDFVTASNINLVLQ